MNNRSKTLLFVILFLSGFCLEATAEATPVINLWYGKEQTFGKPGRVQRWVNVLGQVDPAKEIVKLDFALNDGEFRSLTIGPDDRRLQRPGDFNIEINYQELNLGKNSVVIEAVDKGGQLFSETMELTWAPELVKPDITIDWSTVDQLTDVAQPVDGLWRIEGDRLVSAPGYSGYDRVIGFGDEDWTEFEVLFPFEILSTDPASYESITSEGPALLATLHWQGHSDAPAGCPQPHCGWEPFGGLFGYAFPKEGTSLTELDQSSTLGKPSLMTKWPNDAVDAPGPALEIGVQYWMRARAEVSAMGNYYSLKLWEGALENEPDSWTLQTLAGPLNLSSGSFLLVAHNIDLAVGKIQFIPIGTMRTQIVTLITEFADVLVQLPYLILWIIGILWALAYRRRDPGRGRWILMAFVILFITSLAGFLLISYLPEYLQNQGWITRRLSYLYILIHSIPIGGHFLAWFILFKNLLPEKQPV